MAEHQLLQQEQVIPVVVVVAEPILELAEKADRGLLS
jgi:hypothetical protein